MLLLILLPPPVPVLLPSPVLMIGVVVAVPAAAARAMICTVNIFTTHFFVSLWCGLCIDPYIENFAKHSSISRPMRTVAS